MKRFCFCCLFFPSLLFSQALEERVSQLEKEMKEVHLETAENTAGARFSSDVFQRGWIGVLFTGEALFWHAKAGSTEYAYNLVSQTLGVGAQSGDVEGQSFGWGWGFRVGAGLRFSVVGWELYGNYTRFHTSDTESRSKAFPALLVNLKGAFLSPSSRARSHTDLSYDNANLTLNRQSFMSRFLSVKTAIGVKTSWLDQEQTLHYRLSGSEEVLHVKDRCDFWGIGPMIGLGTKWHLLWGFSLNADVSGSILYGDFNVKHKEETSLGIMDLQGDTSLFSPTLGFFIGLSWDLYRDWVHFGLSLGYEAEYFWRRNASLELEDVIGNNGPPFRGRFQVVRYAEDLTFYGVTLKAQLEF